MSRAAPPYIEALANSIRDRVKECELAIADVSEIVLKNEDAIAELRKEIAELRSMISDIHHLRAP